MTAVFNFTFVPWFRSVAPYIHKFRNQTFVVGIAGEAIAAGKLPHLAQDLAMIGAAQARAGHLIPAELARPVYLRDRVTDVSPKPVRRGDERSVAGGPGGGGPAGAGSDRPHGDNDA